MADSFNINDLLTLMARLREPDYGCPWDLEQSYQSIVTSTLEEAYEVIDAIEQENYPQLVEELGDLLFQVVFYSQLGAEEDRFDFGQVVTAITAKLLRRHPHVFPEGTLDSRINLETDDIDRRHASINVSWERIKQQERQQKGALGIMDDVPKALPAILRAVKLQKRAASVGFDWSSSEGVYDKIQEELMELQQATKEPDQASISEEMGDLLFSVINLARHLDVEPETALRQANQKFEQRFRYLEQTATDCDESLDQQLPETLDLWWGQAKRALSEV